jgi:uncharacterized coiled-coil protein SlyX
METFSDTLGALQQRMVALEARSAEQEQAIRHVLTMLIDHFERALASQDNARIREAGEELDSFLKPYFQNEE